MPVAAITPNWLGDLVMSTDALRLLKDSLGDEPLHAYAPSYLAPLAELILPADETIGFRLRRHLARLHDRVVLAGRMRSRRYRAVVLFPNSLSTALVARMSGAPERVGTPMHARARLLTTPVDPPRAGEHEGDAYMRLAAAVRGAHDGGVPSARRGGQVSKSTRWGGGAAAARLEEPLRPAGLARGEVISVPNRVLDKTRGLLLREGLDPDRERFLVIAPGAAYGPAKRYGAAEFAEVARASSARGLRSVIVGARGDSGAARELAEQATTQKSIDLAGRTKLAEVAGVFALASAFAGNDSGAAHLAGAVGVPTVALFLSTDPVRTSPRGPRVKVLAAEVECRPCMKRTCPRGRYECPYRCRKAITPEAIIGALEELGAFA